MKLTSDRVRAAMAIASGRAPFLLVVLAATLLWPWFPRARGGVR